MLASDTVCYWQSITLLSVMIRNRNMKNLNMKKYFLFACSAILIFIHACSKKEPPVVPPQEDSMITIEQELTDGQEPAVSPDGQKIAYTYNGCIYVMDTSGANVTQLTTGSADVLPRWHPNGQTIGFIRSTPSVYNEGILYSVPASGGGATQLVFNNLVADSLIQASRVSGNITMPIWNWSPDGNYIAFYTVVADSTFLNVISLTNGNNVLLRKTYTHFISDGDGYSFVWSLAGEKIAFISSNEHRNGAVYLYHLLSQSQLVDSTHLFPAFITKTPGSNKYAYYIFKVGPPNIFTTDFISLQIEYSTSGVNGLKWSPNEKYFLYEIQGIVSGALGYKYSNLFIYNLQTRKEYKLTSRGDINLHNLFFEWSNLSNAVYFERFNKICVVSFTILK